MYLDARPRTELSTTEMEQARRGFKALLARRRFSHQFIATHYEELLSIAHTEYVRYLAKGTEIKNPVGWIIHCAWRRTQNLLRAENHRPQSVSTERLGELADQAVASPAELLEEAERAEKVERAVQELSLEERAVVALMYFEGYSFREAGRALGWSHSKTVRRQRSAMKVLRRALGVQNSDQLAVSVGLIAVLSDNLRALAEKCSQMASGFWLRLHESTRRVILGGGGEASGAVASSGVGRTLGICASAVAVACFAGAGTFVAPDETGGREAASPPHPAERRHLRSALPPIESPRQVDEEPSPAAISPPAHAAASEQNHLRQPPRPSPPTTANPESNAAEFGVEGAGTVPLRETASPTSADQPSQPKNTAPPRRDEPSSSSASEFGP